MRLTFVPRTLALAALLAAAPALAELPATLRIATDAESPPYSIAKPDGSVEGYEIDLIKVACEKMAVECIVEVSDFSGMIPALNAGKFDVIMASMSITDKRREVIEFSVPYGGTGNTMAALKGSGLEDLPTTDGKLSLLDPQTPAMLATMAEMLKGKVIGVEAASVSADFAKTNFGAVAEVREYQKSDEITLDLLAGRVDVMVNGRSYIFNAIQQPQNAEMMLVGPVFDEGMFGLGTGLGLRKQDTELKAALDAALTATAAEGIMKALSEKWFGFDVTPASLR
ncbi:transporter substrate-binding domain-containing protein [Paracoccaceae bacterium Fryx2]|nr:transporter substrate-binding domain-containing protein [Paracoccaceae bacterium Fryx2]